MAHYWNPTNFNNAGDVVIPPELADPKIYPQYKYQPDNMDKLNLAVQKSYPFEINIRNRWYND